MYKNVCSWDFGLSPILHIEELQPSQFPSYMEGNFTTQGWSQNPIEKV